MQLRDARRRALALAGLLLLAIPTLRADTALHLALEEAPEGYLAPGEPALLLVRATFADGAPAEGVLVTLAPFGASGVTNEAGALFLRVTSETAAAVDARLEADGAAPLDVPLVWTRAKLAFDAPRAALVGDTVGIALALRWEHDGSPIAGHAAALHAGGHLRDFAETGPDGRATLLLAHAEPGDVAYDLVFDEPILLPLSTSFRVNWSLPVPPPPPPPRPNVPPTFDDVRVELVDGLAKARVVGLRDADGDPIQIAYTWQVDGLFVSGQDSSVHATKPGTRLRVGVVVSDPFSTGHSALSEEILVPTSAPPSARLLMQGTPVAGQAFPFDASASEAAPPTTHRWTFSDGGTAEGARVDHAFAEPGAAWARVEVQDGAGRTSSARLDFVVQGLPTENASAPTPFSWRASDGTTFAFPAPATQVSVLRELTQAGAPALLMRNGSGLVLWRPLGGDAAPVGEATAQPGAPEYRPGLLLSPLAGGAGEGWTLLRAPDPQPGLPFLGAYSREGLSAPSWREGPDLLVLAREPGLRLHHRLEPLRLQAEAVQGATGWRVEADVVGGAPLERLAVEMGGAVLAETREPTLLVDLPVGASGLVRVVARTLAGETVERALTITPPAAATDDTPPAPTPEAPHEVPAANNLPFAPLGLVVLLCATMALLLPGRARR